MVVGWDVIDMYGKCGDSKASMQVFNSMLKKNDVSWEFYYGQSHSCWARCLNSCVDKGKEIHNRAICFGFAYNLFQILLPIC